MGITIIFLLFLAVVSFLVFMSQPKQVSSYLVFNRPKVNIDMKVFDSDQFKNLQSFTEMQNQYSYKATNAKNASEAGFISATSPDQARAILESTGLKVSELKQTQIGRDNPFTPYYQLAPAPSTPSNGR